MAKQWSKRVPVSFEEALSFIQSIIDKIETSRVKTSNKWKSIRNDEKYHHWSDKVVSEFCLTEILKTPLLNLAKERRWHIEDRWMLCITTYCEIRYRYDMYSSSTHQWLYGTLADQVFNWLNIKIPKYKKLMGYYNNDFIPLITDKNTNAGLAQHTSIKNDTESLIKNEDNTINAEDAVDATPLIEDKIIWTETTSKLGQLIAELKLAKFIAEGTSNPDAARAFAAIFLIKNKNKEELAPVNVGSLVQYVKEFSNQYPFRKKSTKVGEIIYRMHNEANPM